MLDALSFVIVLYLVYMTPAMIAIARCRPDAATIFTANVFLGWTVVGWIAALSWALQKENFVQQHSTRSDQMVGSEKT